MKRESYFKVGWARKPSGVLPQVVDLACSLGRYEKRRDKMARIITWYKQHQYQWEREDFRKANNWLFWGTAILALCLYGSIVLMAKLDASGSVIVVVLVAFFVVGGASYASAFAIQWADKKLKEGSDEP